MKIAFGAAGLRTLDYKFSWHSDNPAPDSLTKELLEWVKKTGFINSIYLYKASL